MAMRRRCLSTSSVLVWSRLRVVHAAEASFFGITTNGGSDAVEEDPREGVCVMTDTNQLLATLLAEKGKKYDETRQCISSYDGSIVFLPREVVPGQIVWVELTLVGKTDARGLPMYQARHVWFDLTADDREAIVHEAEMLRSCTVFGETEALALLSARFGNAVDIWKGYQNYFFHESGSVYASKYSLALLPLFNSFAGSPANGLVELLLWIIEGTKSSANGLFTLRQEGKEIDWRFKPTQLSWDTIGKIVDRIAKRELLLSTALVEVDGSGRLNAPGLIDELWRCRNAMPQLPVPDFAADPKAVIPEIAEHPYGRDLGGSPLMAYGALRRNTSTWQDTSFKWMWYRPREDAEQARQESVEVLQGLRRTWAAREALRPMIESLNIRRQPIGLSLLEMGSERFTCQGSRYEYSADQLEQFEREIPVRQEQLRKEAEAQAARIAAEAEAERLRLEAETVRVAAEAEAARKAALAAQMAAEVEAGRALANFSAFVHTSSQRGDGGGYVIAPDGSLRTHDRDEYTKSHQRGTHTLHWDFVFPDEVALTWEGFRDWAEQPSLIRKAPVNGYTPEQLATMARLATKHGRTWEEDRGVPCTRPAEFYAPPPPPEPEVPTVVPVRKKDQLYAPPPSKVKIEFWATSERTHAADEAREIDPDSPFAKLALLKKKMGE